MARGVSLKEKFAAYYRDGYSLTAIVRIHAIDREVVVGLLKVAGFSDIQEFYPHYKPSPPPPPPQPRPRAAPPAPVKATEGAAYISKPLPREWCHQCDRLVYENEASACQSRFCKAKQVAA